MDSTDAKGKGKSLRKRIAAPFRGLGSRLGSKGESSKSEIDLGHDKHIPDFLKRQPDPDWMDIEMMGHWLQKCDAEHGAQCRRPFGMEPSQIGSTSLLIDVRNKCLVDANASSRYACLSYVWGGAKTLKTGKENLGSLKQVNSLEVRRDEIPRTIRDTINLVDQLGIPYLWVDSLCIIQDDAESKHDQIHAMAGIYAGAYVTIIAANGWDADHGLRGIQGVTSPRQLSTFLKSDFEENLQPYSSIWYSRGWTFQEMLFSPRKIMFQYQLAVWECNEAAWHESSLSRMSQPFSVPDHFHPNVSPWQAQIQLSAWPHIRQYIALVRDYSRRKLTYSDDAFPAITSLLSVMSASFSGGFISGLPEMFFDEALLWQPREPMQRRLTSPDRDNPPTWSWAGWEGELTGEAWEEHFNHLLVRRVHFRKWLARGDLTFPVTPTVKWSWGQTLDERFPINPSGRRYMEYLTHRSLPMPSLWESTGLTYVFDGDQASAAAYPLPTLDDDTPRAITARYLFCRTTRAYLRCAFTSAATLSLLGLPQYLSTLLADRYGKWVGSLNLNLGLSNFLEPPPGTEYELVAISAGAILSEKPLGSYLQGDFLAGIGWGHSFKPSNNTPFADDDLSSWKVEEFYYVLWIEWENGIAYRKGLGRVLKEAWEREVKDEIDLILG